MIGYEWRGPCHVWIVETEGEKAESTKEIEEINKNMIEEAEKLNAE